MAWYIRADDPCTDRRGKQFWPMAQTKVDWRRCFARRRRVWKNWGGIDQAVKSG
jgi:hypothetical protein